MIPGLSLLALLISAPAAEAVTFRYAANADLLGLESDATSTRPSSTS